MTWQPPADQNLKSCPNQKSQNRSRWSSSNLRLDGAKVKDWDENAFYVTISVFAVLFLSILFGLWSPKDLLEVLANFF